MKALVMFIFLAESFNCIFMAIALMHQFLGPAVARASMHSDSCRPWSGTAQGATSAMCTFTVEGFFIMRMWRLSEQKKLTGLVFIPYIAGQAFGFAQVIRSAIIRCNLAISDHSPVFVFGTYACRLFGDGVVVVTMCYMLHTRSSGITRHSNTIKIVRALILWSISTGMLTWLCTLLFLVSYLGALPGTVSVGIFYAMADASLPLASLHLSSTSSAQQVHPELQSHESRAD
ncbi:hypothetical protein BYT27DRAFT_6659650 [Phlegmacium glaucopus]|nr:hypothetical protein BYT27DRAFT_6659650 [Phlegmacium glaucopus]